MTTKSRPLTELGGCGNAPEVLDAMTGERVAGVFDQGKSILVVFESGGAVEIGGVDGAGVWYSGVDPKRVVSMRDHIDRKIAALQRQLDVLRAVTMEPT